MIEPDQIVDLTTAEDVTPEILALALEAAEASDGIGHRQGIDWEYAYDLLESVHGYFVTEMDNPADRKIRRAVKAAMKESQ